MDDEEHSTASTETAQQFKRITNIAASWNSFGATNNIIKLTKASEVIETPANL